MTLRLLLLPPETGEGFNFHKSKVPLKCMATGWLINITVTAPRQSLNLVLKHLPVFQMQSMPHLLHLMRRGARKIVLDMVQRFRCQNNGRGILITTGFTFRLTTFKRENGRGSGRSSLWYRSLSWTRDFQNQTFEKNFRQVCDVSGTNSVSFEVYLIADSKDTGLSRQQPTYS